MLSFVITEMHQYTVRGALESRSHPLLDQVLILSWRDFLKLPQLPATDYLFLDVERIALPVRQAAAERMSALKREHPELRVLNPPETDLTRLAVMSRLEAAGINRFRVRPYRNLPCDWRFPAFLRRGDDHGGSASDLLHDMPTLIAEGERLTAQGMPADALLATEFIDARNAEGFFEKRSYFRIGERFFPADLSGSKHWVCKGEAKDPFRVDTSKAEMIFLRGHEDEEQIKRAFDAAKVTYGRADYTAIGGHVQIFEINTNPMIETRRKMPRTLHGYVDTVLGNWLSALEAYAGPQVARAPQWIDVAPASAIGAIEQGPRMRSLVRGALLATGQLQRETRLRRPFRALGLL